MPYKRAINESADLVCRKTLTIMMDATSEPWRVPACTTVQPRASCAGTNQTITIVVDFDASVGRWPRLGLRRFFDKCWHRGLAGKEVLPDALGQGPPM